MRQLCDVLQPQYFESFRCTGAECEDTCCNGWGILIDRETYHKYQDRDAPLTSGTVLRDLVEINPRSCSSSDFARIRLAGTQCPALSHGLCSIQQELGEPWLSDMCSNYPRVLNGLRGQVERSLHLSCPEAARLVLANPDAMVFEVLAAEGATYRAGSVSPIDVSGEQQAARELVIRILRERGRPLWMRIDAMARAVDRFAGEAPERAPAVLRECLEDLRRGSRDPVRADGADTTSGRLETVLELVVARIGSEYASPRFLECYGEFMRGLRWTGESTMDELAARYRVSFRDYFTPFETRHPWLFENYLVNYVFRTLFPYGRRSADQKIVADSDERAMRDALVLMVTHYAIIRTILVGMSGLHESGLTMDHAVKLVQSCTRVFQHSNSVHVEVLRFLGKQPGGAMGTIAMLAAD